MSELTAQDPNLGGRLIRNTIGQDFVIWAEEYWRLKEKYTSGNEESEKTNYSEVRRCFAEAIDRFIEVRLRDADILR